MIELGDRDAVGELLRSRAFLGEDESDLGCYSTFTVREDARFWGGGEKLAFWRERTQDEETAHERAALGQGYSYIEDGLRVELYWYWDGDGTLCFAVWDGERLLRALENSDCKKSYGWDDDIPRLRDAFRAAQKAPRESHYLVETCDPGPLERLRFHSEAEALEAAELQLSRRALNRALVFSVSPAGEQREICRFLAAHLLPLAAPGSLSRPSALAER